MDPLLFAHRLYEHVYSIGGSLEPVSIRDQMIRGQWLVDRLGTEGVIDPGRPLVVIGGGAGGAAAALRAVDLGVPVTVIDRGRDLFTAQQGCDTRWVNPVQYDWAVDHCQLGQYPCTPAGHPVPLPWQEDVAERLVTHWSARVQAAAGHLDRRPHAEWTPVRPLPAGASHPYRIDFHDVRTGIAESVEGAAVILAIGAGREQYSHENTAGGWAYGYAFWASDRYAEPRAGIPAGRPARVLVCGAGDGGIQDFLRLVTKPSYQSVYALYNTLHVPDQLEHQLQSDQAHAHRQYAWGCHRGHDHPILDWIHRRHMAVVRTILNNPAVPEYQDVHKGLADIVRDVATEYSLIAWVHSCSHFGNAYGLNRFLGLLVSEYLIRQPGSPVRLYHSSRLAAIDCHHPPPLPHDRDLDPLYTAASVACHGANHTVHLENRPRCYEAIPNAPVSATLDAVNVLVIRNGMRDLDELRPFSPPVRRQLLPFSVIHG